MPLSTLALCINLNRFYSLKHITPLTKAQTAKTVDQTKQPYSYKQQVFKTLVSHSSLNLLRNKYFIIQLMHSII